jgi:hypothetical protein
MKTEKEIKEEIELLLPFLSFDAHGYGNASRESCMECFGEVDAYLNVLGIKLRHSGTHEDIVNRIKEAI